MSNVILEASDLDGFLTEKDKVNLDEVSRLYSECMDLFVEYEKNQSQTEYQKIIDLYQLIGDKIQEIVAEEDNLFVYPFSAPREVRGEASRLVAKLRDPKTNHNEFVYYIQRSFELLFNLAFGGFVSDKRSYIVEKTPVNFPVQNYAVHKIPYIDDLVKDTVMCVMLRGALLPSMIFSKEIEEYSSCNHVTPFALFRIKRNDEKSESNMQYVMDLKKSYFTAEMLNGKDLIFADPMNATGGSLYTIVDYLNKNDIKPKSITFLNVISALKGSLRVIRAIDNIKVYTLWMDPMLNEKAYILPGLGDAGDRLNGADSEEYPRNIIQLIADYGSSVTDLYRSQIREIEKSVL
ncbi:MAG: uracil phosphoribosyltransferase [Spirochaetales bacterium]|nr:uracil phosphoribosyltransferase [Spirochaetales bacterium]